MEDTLEFYDFSTPVTEDMTLTAVWNDTPNPNNPTLENLRLALLTGEPWKYYPVGTEIPHTDMNGISNPWVILHYGEMGVVGEEGQAAEFSTKFGAVIGLKYCDSKVRSWTYNSAQSLATCIVPLFQNTIEPAIPANERPYFSWTKTSVMGNRLLWFPLPANLTYGSEEVWDYYNEAAQYFNRIGMLGATPDTSSTFSSSGQFFAALSSLSKITYVSGRTYPTTSSTATVSLTTSSTSSYPRYCAFVAAPDESPLNQPEES